MAKKQIEQTEIEAPYELPEGWKWCRLGECSSVISKGTTPKGGKDAYLKEGVNFLRIESLNDDGTINLDNISHISKSDHENFLKRSILEEGDLLISIAGTLGKVGFVTKNDLPMNTNQAIAFVRLYKNLFDNMYLKYAIESPFINSELLKKTKVTSIPNLTLESISNCLFPLPPTLEEQQRIVNRIETLFSKLDQAKEKAQSVVDTFETRKAAILHKAFTGELTKKWREENGVGDDSWEDKFLKDCSTIISGYAFKSSDFLKENNEIPCVKITNVGVGYFSNDDISYLPRFLLSSCENFIVHKNDILISLTRSFINSGLKVCIYELEDIALLNQRVALIKDCNVKYIYNFLRTTDVLNYVKNKSKTTNQPNLSIKDLCDLEIKLPTLLEQQEIVRILDCVLEKENQAKEAAIAVLEQIDLLKKSILARAFRGEL